MHEGTKTRAVAIEVDHWMEQRAFRTLSRAFCAKTLQGHSIIAEQTPSAYFSTKTSRLDLLPFIPPTITIATQTKRVAYPSSSRHSIMGRPHFVQDEAPSRPPFQHDEAHLPLTISRQTQLRMPLPDDDPLFTALFILQDDVSTDVRSGFSQCR